MSHNDLTSPREIPYFVLSVIFSVLVYIIATVSLFGIVILLVVLALALYSNVIMMGSIRGNGIRISEKQFPDVYERVISLSTKMELKKVPDVFVIHSEGAFNAFATRFLGRNVVVIYSEVFELAREQGEAELDFIIAHELTHVKRRHVWKSILTLPALFVPFLSQAYSRSCEYTCDREAAYHIQDGVAAKRALTILGVGKKLYTEVNEDAYLEQIYTESNVAVWLSEVLSSHPLLPKRVQAVGKFMEIDGTPNYYPNTTKIALGAGALFGVLTVVYIGVIVLITAGTITYATVFNSNMLGNTSTDNDYSGEQTPLMEAVSNGDEVRVNKLIASGVNLEEQDYEKSTALHYAIYTDNDTIAKILLEADANPNASDDYSTTLTAALYNENYDLAATLYEYGADPAALDAEGYSAFSMLEVDNEADFLSVLYNQ